jgi:hypothetical protein
MVLYKENRHILNDMLITIWENSWYIVYKAEHIPIFTYTEIINTYIKKADVIWFNKRWFPEKIFQIKQDTNFIKDFDIFNSVQDFRTSFHCIWTINMKDIFENTKKLEQYYNISDRCGFLDFEFIKLWHAKHIKSETK